MDEDGNASPNASPTSKSASGWNQTPTSGVGDAQRRSPVDQEITECHLNASRYTSTSNPFEVVDDSQQTAQKHLSETDAPAAVLATKAQLSSPASPTLDVLSSCTQYRSSSADPKTSAHPGLTAQPPTESLHREAYGTGPATKSNSFSPSTAFLDSVQEEKPTQTPILAQPATQPPRPSSSPRNDPADGISDVGARDNCSSEPSSEDGVRDSEDHQTSRSLAFTSGLHPSGLHHSILPQQQHKASEGAISRSMRPSSPFIADAGSAEITQEASENFPGLRSPTISPHGMDDSHLAPEDFFRDGHHRVLDKDIEEAGNDQQNDQTPINQMEEEETLNSDNHNDDDDLSLITRIEGSYMFAIVWYCLFPFWATFYWHFWYASRQRLVYVRVRKTRALSQDKIVENPYDIPLEQIEESVLLNDAHRKACLQALDELLTTRWWIRESCLLLLAFISTVALISAFWTIVAGVWPCRCWYQEIAGVMLINRSIASDNLCLDTASHCRQLLNGTKLLDGESACAKVEMVWSLLTLDHNLLGLPRAFSTVYTSVYTDYCVDVPDPRSGDDFESNWERSTNNPLQVLSESYTRTLERIHQGENLWSSNTSLEKQIVDLVTAARSQTSPMSLTWPVGHGHIPYTAPTSQYGSHCGEGFELFGLIGKAMRPMFVFLFPAAAGAAGMSPTPTLPTDVAPVGLWDCCSECVLKALDIVVDLERARYIDLLQVEEDDTDRAEQDGPSEMKMKYCPRCAQYHVHDSPFGDGVHEP
ncbi:Hypothetical predicted protein [Lecanosticta acicola]|uniref:Transmembrane protein n=1 Tax=Lecanosticta acicola TaxID=111012 RepID=A0AAI8Z8F1_9PEZI|nr:Hypothetical predicted protein [Lecanosticta acicola]